MLLGTPAAAGRCAPPKVIATKGRLSTGDGPNRHGISAVTAAGPFHRQTAKRASEVGPKVS
jgi:hypothetical protein